jgi:hypothetical protein
LGGEEGGMDGNYTHEDIGSDIPVTQDKMLE